MNLKTKVTKINVKSIEKKKPFYVRCYFVGFESAFPKLWTEAQLAAVQVITAKSVGKGTLWSEFCTGSCEDRSFVLYMRFSDVFFGYFKSWNPFPLSTLRIQIMRKSLQISVKFDFTHKYCGSKWILFGVNRFFRPNFLTTNSGQFSNQLSDLMIDWYLLAFKGISHSK